LIAHERHFNTLINLMDSGLRKIFQNMK